MVQTMLNLPLDRHERDRERERDPRLDKATLVRSLTSPMSLYFPHSKTTGPTAPPGCWAPPIHSAKFHWFDSPPEAPTSSQKSGPPAVRCEYGLQKGPTPTETRGCLGPIMTTTPRVLRPLLEEMLRHTKYNVSYNTSLKPEWWSSSP